METDIKKKLAKNWFKVLQDTICFDIEEIEKKKIKFVCKDWQRSKKKNLATKKLQKEKRVLK